MIDDEYERIDNPYLLKEVHKNGLIYHYCENELVKVSVDYNDPDRKNLLKRRINEAKEWGKKNIPN